MQNSSSPKSCSRITDLRTPHTVQSVKSGRTKPAKYPPVGASLSGHPSRMDAPRSYAPEALRVLMAEDNFANQLIAKMMLLRAGFHVTTVENGEDAIKAASQSPFDIILMDIEMPIQNGIEATQTLRRQPGPNQNTLIIALTAFGSPAEKYTYSQSGIDHILTKPFRMDAFGQFLKSKNMDPCWNENTISKIHEQPNTIHKIANNHQNVDLIDLETISALFNAAGFDGLMPILKAYWRSAYALLTDMQKAHQMWDRAELQKSAHALKGASVNIGLPAIGRLAAALQISLSDDNNELLDTLDVTMTRSRKALASEIARLKQQARATG